MTVKIRDTSRLRWARLITLGDVEHWELPEYPAILPAPDDIKYTVDANDRIDLLSNRFYGAPDLWWIIAIVNNIRLLPNGLNANTQIRIPSPRRVFQDIMRKPSRGLEGR